MEPPLCVVSSWIIRVYIILVWNTISGSSNLDNCFYHCLILISISYLKALFIIIIIIIIIIVIINIVVVVVIVLLLFIIYIVILPKVPPVLPGYLLLRHSCTWEKTSIFWSCHLSLSSFFVFENTILHFL